MSNTRLEVIADGFNMLNDFSPTGIDNRLGRNFAVTGTTSIGSPRTTGSLVPGRQIRLGARVVF